MGRLQTSYTEIAFYAMHPECGKNRLLFCRMSVIRINSKAVHWVTLLKSVTHVWVSGTRMYFKCFRDAKHFSTDG